MKYLTLLFAALTAVTTVSAFAQEPTTLIIPMHALNGSHEDGTATLTQGADGVHVTVSLQNAPDNPQPTHIHIGSCSNINKAPEYALVDTQGGRGDSIVRGVKLDDLLKGSYAINVHKSGFDLGTYASCGDIKHS
jgi:hypothetical protein